MNTRWQLADNTIIEANFATATKTISVDGKEVYNQKHDKPKKKYSLAFTLPNQKTGTIIVNSSYFNGTQLSLVIDEKTLIPDTPLTTFCAACNRTINPNQSCCSQCGHQNQSIENHQQKQPIQAARKALTVFSVISTVFACVVYFLGGLYSDEVKNALISMNSFGSTLAILPKIGYETMNNTRLVGIKPLNILIINLIFAASFFGLAHFSKRRPQQAFILSAIIFSVNLLGYCMLEKSMQHSILLLINAIMMYLIIKGLYNSRGFKTMRQNSPQ